jgi:lysophospholipase L1-like esterase
MSHARIMVVCLTMAVVAALGAPPASLHAQAPPAAGYVAVGDSIEFGLGDDNPVNGIGYVSPFGAFLAVALGQPVQVHNFSVPAADTRDILLTQLRAAAAAAQSHRPIVVSWGGGGIDVGRVALDTQDSACKQIQSCFGRFNAVLNEARAAIDRTIATLRQAAGPEGRILMRTQYNALAKTGCAPTPDAAALGNAVLEGVPGTVLDEGLNDRIRAIAAKYDAQVVDLFIPFAINPNAFVANDCIHPSGAGYDVILSLFQAALVSQP